MILVDSSVLIDVIEEQDVRWADWSESQITQARSRDTVGINLLVNLGQRLVRSVKI